jgi:uncharacterized protein
MGNPGAAHEPSMEEILASIRQIISEDGEQTAEDRAPGEARAEAPATEDDTPAEPVEAEAPAEEQTAGWPADESLSNSAERPPESEAAVTVATQEQPSLRRRLDEPEAAQSHDVTPSLPSEAQSAPLSPPGPQPEPQPAPRTDVQAAAPRRLRDRPLLSSEADDAVSGAFSALAHTMLAQNARTLEDLVAEMLRPMLKEWLDDNLPALVERLVREEIERVSRGRR